MNQDNDQGCCRHHVFYNHREDYIFFDEKEHIGIELDCTNLKEKQSEIGIQETQDQNRNKQDEIAHIVSIHIIVMTFIEAT